MPPSFLLFVMDTTRADSVSADGAQRATAPGTTPGTTPGTAPGTAPVTAPVTNPVSTTPYFDALAADGLRYTRAYANAPWTLPSHASIFTGLLPHQHGVNWNRTTVPDELVTLAERLQQAGYQTVGFSENPWLGNGFNLNQGFEHFQVVGKLVTSLDEALTTWLPARDAERPLFLFVNVVDAHAPYAVLDTNAFLPEGVDRAAAAAVDQDEKRYMCRAPQFASELSVLHGLYLGGVAAADAKLRMTLTMLRANQAADPLITVSTSDHGEHFGEHGFVGHVAGLHEALVHVPLLVHGLPGHAPSIIETPVQLTAIAPTLLALANLPLAPEFVSAPLPTHPPASTARSDGAAPRPIVAEWTDPGSKHEQDERSFVGVHRLVSHANRKRCQPRDRAAGNMRTLVEYPYQLITYEHHPPALIDLSVAVSERRDLGVEKPELLRELLRKLEATRSQPVLRTSGAPAPETPLSQEVEAQLRALGYLD